MFKHLVWISAMIIAATAALFSVTGIATLYSGALIAVAIMAGAMELGKIVAASYLYRYWKLTPKSLKAYLMTGVVTLMFITSLGIYAYLTAAYAEVAAEPTRIMNEVSFIDTRQSSLNESITRYQRDIQSIDDRRVRVEARLDSTLLGSTDLNQRSAWANTQTQLGELDTQRSSVQSSLEQAIVERDSLELEKTQKRAELNEDSKIGTFVYVADIIGIELDDVVKYFTLIIVFVFDPLAISLILAYNIIHMSEQKNKKTKNNIPSRPTVPSYVKPDIFQIPVTSGVDEEDVIFDSPNWDNPYLQEFADDQLMQVPDPRVDESEVDELDKIRKEYGVSVQEYIDSLKQDSGEEYVPDPNDPNYFIDPRYDWENDTRWRTDERAIRYHHLIDRPGAHKSHKHKKQDLDK